MMKNLFKKAATWVSLSMPWFASSLARLKVEEVIQCPDWFTMGTDGKKLYVSYKNIQGLQRETMSFIIAHEIVHNLLGHTAIRCPSSFNESIYRLAQEHQVNAWLVGGFGMHVPSDIPCIIDTKYVNTPWTLVEIYYDLLRSQDKQSNSSNNKCDLVIIDGSETTLNGDIMVDPNATNEELEIMASKASKALANVVERAKKARKLQGSFSGSQEDFLNLLVTPKVSIRREISGWVTSMYNPSTTWRRYRKRELVRNIYLPAYNKTTISLAYVMDTSGSMSLEDLQEGITLLHDALLGYDGFMVTALAVDASVCKDYSFTHEDSMATIRENICSLGVGRGGTSFVPAFEFVEANPNLRVDIGGLVYFTDGYGDFPEEIPDYPVLWVMTNKEIDPPFGKKIIYYPEER